MINRILFIALFLVIGASLIYFFQIKPSEIRSQCDQIAWNNAEYKEYDSYWKKYNQYIDNEKYEWKYNQCLHSKGLK